jgi:transposase-like protein
MFTWEKTRREFTSECKDEAVKLVINTGRAVATVARELGINEASLGRWVIAFKARNDTGEKKSVRHPGSIGYEGKAFKLMLADKANFTITRMVPCSRCLDRATTSGSTGSHRTA